MKLNRVSSRTWKWVGGVGIVVAAFVLYLIVWNPEVQEGQDSADLQELSDQATDQAEQACLSTEPEQTVDARSGYLKTANEYRAKWLDATQDAGTQDAELLPKRLPDIDRVMRIICPRGLPPLPEGSTAPYG